MQTKIIVNGQEYEKVEDMPPEVRSLYERMLQKLPDKNQNGIPDILEGQGFKVFSQMQGTTISNITLGKSEGPLADMIEGALNALETPGQQPVAALENPQPAYVPVVQSGEPVMEEVGANPIKLLLWILIIVGLFILAGLAYLIFFR
jgi:hypothetical protein